MGSKWEVVDERVIDRSSVELSRENSGGDDTAHDFDRFLKLVHSLGQGLLKLVILFEDAILGQ